MNPEKPSREEIEARLTALLLGELPAEEAQLLRWAISQDAALAQMHDELKLAIELVREVAATPVETIPAQNAPLKLSDERREKLFAHFKTVALREFVPLVPPLKKRREISPLIAMAAAIALIAVLAAMLLPALASAKRKARNITMLSASEKKFKFANDDFSVDQNSPAAATPRATPPPVAAATSLESVLAPPGEIVLPQVQNSLAVENEKLAAATPAQSGFFSSITASHATLGGNANNDSRLPGVNSSLDQNAQVTTLKNADPYEAAQMLQKMFGGKPAQRGTTTTSPLATRAQTMFSTTGGAQQPAELAGRQLQTPAQDNLALLDTAPNSNAQQVGVSGNNNSGGNGGGAAGIVRGGRGEGRNRLGGGGFGGGGRGGGGVVMSPAAPTTGDAWQAPTLATAPAVAPPTQAGAYTTLNGLNGYVDVSAQSNPDAVQSLPNYTFGNKANAVTENGLTRDDVSGTKFLFGAGQLTVAQNQPVDQRRFYRTPAPNAAAEKPPMLGDVPEVGRLFQSESSLTKQDGEIAARYQLSGDIGSPQNIGEADRKSTTLSGGMVNNGTLALNGANSFNGGIRVNGDNLAVAKDEISGKPYFNLPDSAPGDLAYVNKGTVGSAATVDYDTHNLVISADTATTEQIQDTLKKFDQSPAAAPAEALARLRAERAQELQPGLAGGGVINNPVATSALTPLPSQQVLTETPHILLGPVPTVAPPAPVYSAAVVGYANITNSAVLNHEAKSGAQASAAPMIVTDAAAIGVLEQDRPIEKTPSPAPVPTPEILTRENAFSTFSLNVSDVSFKLAAASLEKGQLPDAASIRTEEFINAFNYHDPEPAAGVPVAFVSERARYPFAQNRDLLRFSLKTAAAGRSPGRPLNLVLLLDDSGSMERADRVAIIHEALKVLAAQLQPQDTLSIVTFARTARLWVDGARGDQAGTAVNQVSDLTPEGGTNLEEAMNLAYATARRHYLANGGNRVVLLTDGAANLGNVDPEALKQKVESFRKQGIALDCFGIGWEGYNDDLLEVLSSNGDGRYGFINTPEAATTEFAAQLAGALHVAAEDVKVQVEFNPQRVISWRQIGYAKHQLTKEQFRDNTVAAAPMAAREAGNALYTVEVNPQGEGPIATVRVRFRIPGTSEVSEHEWQAPFDGAAPALEKSSPALRLAATASAFSEWLAQSQFAQEVTTDRLLNCLNGVPAIYGADARPKQLETMIREANSISGQPSKSGSGGTLF